MIRELGLLEGGLYIPYCHERRWAVFAGGKFVFFTQDEDQEEAESMIRRKLKVDFLEKQSL